MAPVATAARSGKAEGLAQNRAFWWLWSGQAASQLGDRIHQVAVLWWAVRLHGRASDASWVMIATTLPLVLFSPLTGALADRFERRRLMLACDLGRAGIVAWLFYLAGAGFLTMPWLVSLSLALATLSSVFSPAALAIVPDVVGPADLVKAGSLQEMAMQGAGLVGPPLGGLLVAAIGTKAAFGANAASFLISASALWVVGRISRPASGGDPDRASTPARASAPGGWARRRVFDLRTGLSAAIERPTIGLLLLAFGLVNFFLAPVIILLPKLARQLDVGARGLGAFEGALALGMLAASGAIALRRASPPAESADRIDHRQRRRAAISLVLIGGFVLAISAWPAFQSTLVFLAALGATLGTLNVLVVAYFQQSVPPDRLGRFMGLLTAVVFASQPLGFAASGRLADTTSVSTVLSLSGGGIVLVGLLLLAAWPILRQRAL